MLRFRHGRELQLADASFLGCISYGLGSQAPEFVDAVVPMAVLPEGGLVHTAWWGGACRSACWQGVRYRFNEELLFGVVVLDERDFPGNADTSALQRVSQVAYERLFAVMEYAGFPSLVRCWNYLPNINAEMQGRERYRQFNVGRQKAFDVLDRSFGVPAACALGTHEGSLILYFLASRNTPQLIENPRQLSAWMYPEQYGPRSPLFSRASLLSLSGGEALFISGTASIVGHESCHSGDICAQTAETLRNIEVVVEQANQQSRLKGFTVRDLQFKVFLRNATDLSSVQRVMTEVLGPELDVLCVQADVCRAELLVEIEAVSFRNRGD